MKKMKAKYHATGFIDAVGQKKKKKKLSRHSRTWRGQQYYKSAANHKKTWSTAPERPAKRQSSCDIKGTSGAHVLGYTSATI